MKEANIKNGYIEVQEGQVHYSKMGKGKIK